MIKYYAIQNNILKECGQQEAIWLHSEIPTEEEFSYLQETAGIPAHILKDVQDANEMPHIDFYIKNKVMFFDIPVTLDAVPKNQTRPLCIIIGEQRIFTITSFNFGLAERLNNEVIEQISSATDILLLILFTLMASYIGAIKQMEENSNWSAKDLRQTSSQNSMFYELLDFQKSMIDFETSIEANHNVLQTILQDEIVPMRDYQKLWLNNIIIESSQIANMCNVFSNVLDATGNIAESVVSNNLNDVMKTLTSLTILFSVPTIITAIFTMNTAIPNAVNHIIFPLLFSLIMGGLVLWFLKRRNMF